MGREVLEHGEVIKCTIASRKSNKITLFEATQYAKDKGHTRNIFWNIEEDLKTKSVYLYYQTTKKKWRFLLISNVLFVQMDMCGRNWGKLKRSLIAYSLCSVHITLVACLKLLALLQPV